MQTTFDEQSLKDAVEIHERDADWFEAQYDEQSEGRNAAFLYGRERCDRYMWETVETLPAGARALDVGCGTGVLIERLRDRGFDAVGIEPAERMRRHAEKRLPPGVVRDGSVVSLAWPDETFHLVTAVEVFRYLDGAANAAGIREVHRVLAPGGYFFGTFVNSLALDGYRALVGARRLRGFLGGAGPDHHTEFETPRRLRRRLLAAGFSDVTLKGAMFAPLRIAYRYAPAAAPRLAALVSPFDEALTNGHLGRPFAGHLIAIARK